MSALSEELAAECGTGDDGACLLLDNPWKRDPINQWGRRPTSKVPSKVPDVVTTDMTMDAEAAAKARWLAGVRSASGVR